jgi:hypothetical protein
MVGRKTTKKLKYGDMETNISLPKIFSRKSAPKLKNLNPITMATTNAAMPKNSISKPFL